MECWFSSKVATGVANRLCGGFSHKFDSTANSQKNNKTAG
jgi:hypothetical protein